MAITSSKAIPMVNMVDSRRIHLRINTPLLHLIRVVTTVLLLPRATTTVLLHHLASTALDPMAILEVIVPSRATDSRRTSSRAIGVLLAKGIKARHPVSNMLRHHNLRELIPKGELIHKEATLRGNGSNPTSSRMIRINSMGVGNTPRSSSSSSSNGDIMPSNRATRDSKLKARVKGVS